MAATASTRPPVTETAAPASVSLSVAFTTPDEPDVPDVPTITACPPGQARPSTFMPLGTLTGVTFPVVNT
ncbi:hypothetical protein BM536_016255 [Streptomyces phaeoluteigriseus]|uniref:Uncharacterized protein n=1 Tax=Streptomyces phaeoluteigriseus TaxID=114686 RepID=A0A1V6MU26_9ACTN|nr:hypothetical protein BM536_016255 [Streptomyces phaeoluteigriseus]